MSNVHQNLDPNLCTVVGTPDAADLNDHEIRHDDRSRFNRVVNAVKSGTAKAVIFAEVSPLNEAVRYSVFAASQVGSDNPLAGALAYGGATLAVEGSAAVLAANHINSERDNRTNKVINWINKKIGGEESENKEIDLPVALEAGLALGGGSVVAMAAKQTQDPTRTIEQNRRYGLLTSAWLAGVCAVQGALMSEGIQHPEPETIGGALLAVGGIVAAWKWARERYVSELRSEGGLTDYNQRFGFMIQCVDNDSQVAREGLQLEQAIWQKHNYGDELAEYSDFIEQSRVFVAIKDNEIIGITRTFKGKPLLPPFMALPIASPQLREELALECQDGLVEELATAAVSESARKGVVSTSLWRLAYRDALSRGVKKWGIIMEPERVKTMNKRYGFTFQQIGSTQQYQGGECAAHIMDLYEVQESMKITHPEVLQWFVEEPLGSVSVDAGVD